MYSCGSELHSSRPSRASKRKFYDLLSTIVKKGKENDNNEDNDEKKEEEEPTEDKRKRVKTYKRKVIGQAMLEGRCANTQVLMVEGKGIGVRIMEPVSCGQYVVEYAGELITRTEALRRERSYAIASATRGSRKMNCYMYFFEHRGQEMCVDATDPSYGCGRSVNHSVNGNLDTVKAVVKGIPRLALVANRDIEEGEELSYDYGDRFGASLVNFPWLSS